MKKSAQRFALIKLHQVREVKGRINETQVLIYSGRWGEGRLIKVPPSSDWSAPDPAGSALTNQRRPHFYYLTDQGMYIYIYNIFFYAIYKYIHENIQIYT